jgi:predicted DNA-binding transcriptional regulator AlpA
MNPLNLQAEPTPSDPVAERAAALRQTPGFVDRLVRERERQHITCVSRAHWARLEAVGKTPRRVLVGARRVAWRLSDLMAWVDSRAAVADSPEARAMRAPPVLSRIARGEHRT